MKKIDPKRRIVETMTEVTLAFVLLGIIGISFAVLRDLNPVPKQDLSPVLGESISTIPWEFKTDPAFEQTNLVKSEKSFVADYNLAISRDNPVSSYTLFTLNNPSGRDAKFRIIFTAREADLKNFKITGLIAKRESVIYDASGDKKFYNLEITLPPRSTQDFSLLVNSLTDAVTDQLTATLTVQMP